MVTDFVTEMADQGTVRLVHLGAARLAFGIVGFGNVERDLAFVMTGEHLRAGIFRKKIENDAVRWILGSALHRQTEPQEIVDHAMFGAFDLLPKHELAGLAEIRNGAIEFAGKA